MGYCVVFNVVNGVDNSYIMHKSTKNFLKMRREKGVYVIDAFADQEIGPDFSRLG